MNVFIEIAITKYVKEYPKAKEMEVLVYLESLGYSKEELDKFDLSGLMPLTNKS